MTVPVPGSLTYSYDEDGVTTVFPYPVRFLEPQELTVIREVAGAQTVLAYNVDYTVSGAGNPAGGSITRTAVTDGGKIIIARSTAWKQIVDLEDKARNPAQSVEEQLDRLTMAGQDTNERLDGKADTTDLAPVAFSGDYDDLENKPVIPPGTVTSVGLNAATGFTVSGSPVVGSGTLSFAYAAGYQPYTSSEASKLGGIAAQATKNQADAYLLNRANHTGVQAISTVTGLQSALDGKTDKAITISAGAGLSGGGTLAANRTIALSAASQAAIAAATSAVQPGDLAAVATTGSYSDLVDKPTIPPAQVNSDWNATSGVAQILNKPTLGTASAANVGDFATATQGSKADTAVQPGDLGDLAAKDKVEVSDIDASGTPSSSTFLRGDGVWSPGGGGGGGDVVGPSSVTDGEMAVFDGVSGKLIKGGGAPFSGAYGDLSGVPASFPPSAHTHAAGDITSGTLADARIPSLAISKITNLQTSLNAKFDNPSGTEGQYIRGDGSLAAFPAIPAGTVTSVGMSMPTGFSVSGSPVTGAGTFAVTYASGYQGYTTAEASKLAGIAAGAQVNIPVGTGAGTVAAGDDSRIVGAVQTSRSIATQHSLQGGGNLSADRTLSLVGDVATPGNNKVYGTDASGTKGWKDDPSGGGAGVAKAWVNFKGTGTVAIRDSFNVSSITDNGTGDYTINFSTALANADYAVVMSGLITIEGGNWSNAAYGLHASTVNIPTLKTTSAVRVSSGHTGNQNKIDPSTFSVVIFGA